MAEVTIDFEGAPPAAGRQFHHVPPGTYTASLKGEIIDTSTGKKAVSVTFTITKGEQKGRKIGDLFVIPRKGGDDSNFGIQRLNALVVATGHKSQTKKVKGNQLVKALAGKVVIIEVDDNEIPATSSRPATITSRPVNYYRSGSSEAKEAMAMGGGARTTPDEDEEESGGDDPDEAEEDTSDTDDGDGDDEEPSASEDDASDLFEED